jgi:hypothetical protein
MSSTDSEPTATPSRGAVSALEPAVPALLRRERMLTEIREREFVRVGELGSPR